MTHFNILSLTFDRRRRLSSGNNASLSYPQPINISNKLMTTPNSAIVAAGVGATFSLLRLCADLISKASETAKQSEEKIENSKPTDAKDVDVDNIQRSTLGRRLSLMNINGRLSMGNINAYTRRRSSTLVRMNVDASTRSAAVATDVEEAAEEEEEPMSRLEACIPILSLVIHILLFGYFLSATILTTTSSNAAYVDAIYDSIPLGCATAAVFLGLILNIRDFHRQRFSSLQRMLYSMSALILWVGYVFVL